MRCISSGVHTRNSDSPMSISSLALFCAACIRWYTCSLTLPVLTLVSRIIHDTEDGISHPANFQSINCSNGKESKYSEGAAAIAGQQIQSIKDSIGGDAEYTKLQSWATQNLPESDIKEFDALLNQGNVSAIKWGVQGLYSQYKNAMGTEPDLVSGKSGQSGVTPFRSSAEVQAAMKDPRYGKDVTYTENVYARMADSDVFSTKR